MKIWKNTKTLDSYVSELKNSVSPSEAEIAVLGGKPIDLKQFPNLKGIFKCGVGTDNVPFDSCNNRGIRVGLPGRETAEIIFDETACFTVHLILSMLYSDIGDLESWKKENRPRLASRNVLLVGQGNIGSKVKDKLSSLVKVQTYDIMTHPESELEPLIRQADVISLHIPLHESTCEWFDHTKLGWMRDGSTLVNTARGPIVDESALLTEIESGRLRAAFDVFWKEPYEGPLKVFHPHHFAMTPHVASTCDDFLKALADDFYSFITSFQK